MNAYCALDELLTYQNTKTAIFQAELARDQKQSYDHAITVASKEAQRSPWLWGLVYAVGAGAGTGVALYHAIKKDEE